MSDDKELHSVDTLCVWTQALCIHSHSSVLLPSSFRCYSQSHQTTECLLRFFQWSVLQVRVRPPSRRLCSFTHNVVPFNTFTVVRMYLLCTVYTVHLILYNLRRFRPQIDAIFASGDRHCAVWLTRFSMGRAPPKSTVMIR